MNRQQEREVELPDYLEIGTQEVYEDPGSTLPQDLFLPNHSRADAAHNKSSQPNSANTLPPDQTDLQSADDVRVSGNSQGPQAIVAGYSKSGRLKHDGPQPKRVLVVVNDLTARLYVRARLMLRGNVQIFEAIDASECLNLLKTLPPFDAALLDVDMGTHSGFELCKSIRSWTRSQGGKQPTICMIADHNSVLVRIRAKMAGSNNFLSKPLLPKELARLLAKL
jgi:PleD family two-component response regulator